MKVNVINRSGGDLPSYATPQSAGMDLRAAMDESITLGPLERALVPTGLYVELPQGYEMQIRPRSGLAAKRGLAPANKVGVIDADYRGEVMVALHNHSDVPAEVAAGERVAQLAIVPFLKAEFSVVDELSDTVRGEGGFGSTGRK